MPLGFGILGSLVVWRDGKEPDLSWIASRRCRSMRYLNRNPILWPVVGGGRLQRVHALVVAVGLGGMARADA